MRNADAASLMAGGVDLKLRTSTDGILSEEQTPKCVRPNLVETGALRPPGFENQLFAATAGGSLATYAHGYLLNLVAGLEIRVDIQRELLPTPGDCSIGT